MKMLRLFLFVSMAFVWLFMPAYGRQPLSANGVWSSKFPMAPGMDDDVYVFANFRGHLIAGGPFTKAVDAPARGLASWDGSKWTEFGGITGAPASTPSVFALAVEGTNLYVGGRFDSFGGVPARNIAKWDGEHWTALGEGVGRQAELANYPPTVTSLCVIGTNVYAGGIFTMAGTEESLNIARWDGSAWHSMDRGVYLHGPYELPPGYVWSFAGDGENLYVGGRFTRAGAGGILASNLVRWTGAAWEAAGNVTGGQSQWTWEGEPLSGEVESLEFFRGQLYVAGDFGLVNGLAISNVARFTSSGWEAPFHVSAPFGRFSPAGGEMFFSGVFDRINDTPATNLIVINAEGFSPVNALLPQRQQLICAAKFGSDVFLGGRFSAVNGVSAGNIIQQTANGWKAFGSGESNSPDGIVSALASDGTNVFAAGYFWNAGGTSVPQLAKWNGSNWSGIGEESLNIQVIAAQGTNLYGGGWFTLPEVGATNLAVWNGQQWNAIGTNAPSFNYVQALKVVGGVLYASGAISDPDGHQHFACLAWDGVAWKNVWIGNSYVFSEVLAEDGDRVLIARTYLLSSPQTQVARWDGAHLEMMGGELPIEATALASDGVRTFLAGRGPNATLLEWNGATWRDWSLDIPENSNIRAIILAGDRLILTGWFRSIAGVEVNGIAEFSGGAWRPLDGGLHNRGGALGAWCALLVGKKLYVGGDFNRAGSVESGNFAVWQLASEVGLRIASDNIHALEISGGMGDRVEIQRSDDLGIWKPIGELMFSAPTQNFVDRLPGAEGRFYRARIVEP